MGETEKRFELSVHIYRLIDLGLMILILTEQIQVSVMELLRQSYNKLQLSQIKPMLLHLAVQLI